MSNTYDTYDEYDEAIRQIPFTATRVCQITKREKICDISVPLKLLYDEMIKAKEIPSLSSLPLEGRRGYWKETKGERHERIVVCQALYMYDLITEYISVGFNLKPSIL
jgi:hypothetical protein